MSRQWYIKWTRWIHPNMCPFWDLLALNEKPSPLGWLTKDQFFQNILTDIQWTNGSPHLLSVNKMPMKKKSMRKKSSCGCQNLTIKFFTTSDNLSLTYKKNLRNTVISMKNHQMWSVTQRILGICLFMCRGLVIFHFQNLILFSFSIKLVLHLIAFTVKLHKMSHYIF